MQLLLKHFGATTLQCAEAGSISEHDILPSLGAEHAEGQWRIKPEITYQISEIEVVLKDTLTGRGVPPNIAARFNGDATFRQLLQNAREAGILVAEPVVPAL